MYDEIVVALDGSRFSELALPYAYGIARRFGGSVAFLTVLPPLSVDAEGNDRWSQEAGRYLVAREEAERYHSELRDRIEAVGWNVPTAGRVEMGAVAEEIDRHVRAAEADLLVMTTHGRGPLRRAWLGSVADGILRRTPCPILAIRPRPDQSLSLVAEGFRHLLVPLDGSQKSREILPFAGEMARGFSARISLLRVVPPHVPVSSALVSHLHQGIGSWDDEEQGAREALGQEAMQLREQGVSVDVRVLKGNHPADGILSFLASEPIDLVAMTTHGRGGVARMILGSVADKVLRGATTPVLLHRAQ